MNKLTLAEEDVEERVREHLAAGALRQVVRNALGGGHRVDEVGLGLERGVVRAEVRLDNGRVVETERGRVAGLAAERARLVRGRDEPLVEVPQEFGALRKALHRDAPCGIGVLEAGLAGAARVVGRAEDGRVPLADSAAILEERV